LPVIVSLAFAGGGFAQTRNPGSCVAGGDAGVVIAFNGAGYRFDSKTGDLVAAAAPGCGGFAPAAPSDFENKNMLLASADGSADACSMDYDSPCRPPGRFYRLGECAYRTWFAWTVPCGGAQCQTLARLGPNGVTVYPASASGIAAGTPLRDFFCSPDGTALFATGGGGAFSNSGGGWSRPYSSANGLLDDDVSGVYCSGAGCWFVTAGGAAFQAAGGGWTRWKADSVKISGAPRAGPDWIVEKPRKKLSAKIIAAGNGYYCVNTGARYRGWVRDSVVFRNKGAFSPQDVHEKQSEKSASAFAVYGCPRWTLQRETVSEDGLWLAAETDCALIPFGEAAAILSKQ